MTVLEQIYEFYQLLETVDEKYKVEEKPDTNTILTALNIGQLRYVYEKYLSKPTLSENIEYLQKRSDDLRNIIKRSTVRTVPILTGHLANIAYASAFPEDYLFYIRSDSKVQRTGDVLNTEGEYIWTPNVIARSYEHVEQALTGLYNKPILRQPIVTLEETATGIIIIVDSYTLLLYDENVSDIKGLSLTYLRKPLYMGLTAVNNQIVTTCELATHTHEEIVRYSVDIYLKEYKYMLSKPEDGKNNLQNN